MGGSFVEKGIQILNESKIPTFKYPDEAAWSFATMWKYSENLSTLYETPSVGEKKGMLHSKEAENLIRKVRKTHLADRV